MSEDAKDLLLKQIQKQLNELNIKYVALLAKEMQLIQENARLRNEIAGTALHELRNLDNPKMPEE